MAIMFAKGRENAFLYELLHLFVLKQGLKQQSFPRNWFEPGGFFVLLFDRRLGLFDFFGVVAFFAGLLAGLLLGLAARVGLRLPLRDPMISN